MVWDQRNKINDDKYTSVTKLGDQCEYNHLVNREHTYSIQKDLSKDKPNAANYNQVFYVVFGDSSSNEGPSVLRVSIKY